MLEVFPAPNQCSSKRLHFAGNKAPNTIRTQFSSILGLGNKSASTRVDDKIRGRLRRTKQDPG